MRFKFLLIGFIALLMFMSESSYSQSGVYIRKMNPYTNRWDLVTSWDSITALIGGESQPDSLYVSYGCDLALADGWLFSGDTLKIDTCYEGGGESLWLWLDDWLYPANDVVEVHIDTLQSIHDDTLAFDYECDTMLYISSDDDIVYMDRTLYPDYIALTGAGAYYYLPGDTIAGFTCADYTVCDPPPEGLEDTIVCCNMLSYDYFYVDSVAAVDDTVFYYGSYDMSYCWYLSYYVLDPISGQYELCTPEITYYVIDLNCVLVIDSIANLPVVVNDSLRVIYGAHFDSSMFVRSNSSNLPFLEPTDPLGWFVTTKKGTGQFVRVPMIAMADTLTQVGIGYWDLIYDHLEPKNDIDTVHAKILRTDTIASLTAQTDCIDTNYVLSGEYVVGVEEGEDWHIKLLAGDYAVSAGDGIGIYLNVPDFSECACDDFFPVFCGERKTILYTECTVESVAPVDDTLYVYLEPDGMICEINYPAIVPGCTYDPVYYEGVVISGEYCESSSLVVVDDSLGVTGGARFDHIVTIDSALYLRGLKDESKLAYVLGWLPSTGNTYPVPVSTLSDTLIIGGIISVADSTWHLTADSGVVKVQPYSAKKESDPGYAYFYNDRDSTTIGNYGYLYNHYAIEGIGNNSISAEGWHIPSRLEDSILADYLGGWETAGSKLKETDLIHWNSPNSDATNDYGFSAIGSGKRVVGNFTLEKRIWARWGSTLNSQNGYYSFVDIYNEETYYNLWGYSPRTYGYSVRLIKDETELIDGEYGIYIGNDGKEYLTVCIGSQEWLAQNLYETKYRGGSDIPTVTDKTLWNSLSTGAKCAYDNNENKATYDYTDYYWYPTYTSELKLDGILDLTDIIIQDPDLATTSYSLYYDNITKRVTYDSAGSGTGANLWSKNGNALFPTAYATDSVGIGTDTPTAKLDVRGEIWIENDSTYITTLNKRITLGLIDDVGNSMFFNIDTNSQAVEYVNDTTQSSYGLSIFDESHSFYVGTSATPSHQAEITASSYTTGQDPEVQLYTSTNDNLSFLKVMPDSVSITSDSTIINGDLTVTGLDSARYDYQLFYDKTTGDITYDSAVSGMGANLWSKNGNALFPTDFATDSVGIGTDTPTERLDVQNGNINLDTTSATSGQIKQAGTVLLHTYHEKGDNNLFIGQGAGNFTADSSFNIGIGKLALSGTTLGYSNIAIGDNALLNNTKGYNNIAIGQEALKTNTEKTGNIAIGDGALKSANSATTTDQTNNIAIGTSSMNGSGTPSNNIGTDNIAIGSSALFNYTSADNTVAIGSSAGQAVTTGDGNVFVGHQSGISTTTGGNNTAIGYFALYQGKGGNLSTAVGSYALQNANSSTSEIYTENTAIGGYAMRGSATPGNNTGILNTSVGYSTMLNFTSADSNTIVGVRSLYRGTTASRNVIIGTYAADSITTGSGNIIIGNEAGGKLTTQSNQLYIENSNSATPLIYGDFAKDSLVINGDLTVNAIKSVFMRTDSTPTPFFNLLANEDDTLAIFGMTDWTTYQNSVTIDREQVVIAGNTEFYNDVVLSADLSVNGNVLYTDTHWDDLTVSATAAKQGANDKPAMDYTNIGLLFPYNDTTHFIVENVQMPHRYAPGTDLYPHVHYIQPGANDTAAFVMKYRWYNMGDAVPAFTRIETKDCTIYPYSAGNLHQLAVWDAIDGTGKEESSILDIIIFRKVSTGLNGTILLKDFDIHFQINKPGTYNEYP